MNIFQRVALRSLQKNKVRTLVTIVGVILSAAMICAVTTFAASIYNYALENAVYNDGDWHGAAFDERYAAYAKIKDSKKVKTAAYADQLGYAYAEGCINDYKPYIYLLGAGEGFADMLPVHITEGAFPTTNSEILLPQHLYENGGVKYHIGDTVTLQLGDRVSDGYLLGQHNPYAYDEETGTPQETLQVRESRTYTVVGFYERPTFESYTAPGYTAITVSDGGDAFPRSIWFKMKRAGDVYDFFEKGGYSGTYNSSVLTYSGASGYTNVNVMITSLAAIVIALIMFGSVSLIYNAFSISVAERTRQFGLLSSIGATKRQLGKTVLYEALMVSAVGIPMGIVSGVVGIGVTLFFVGEKFKALSGFPIPLTLHVSAVSLIAAVVIALLTVLISAWLPSRRATRVSAVEAIRQNRDVRVEKGKQRSQRLGITYRLFGLSGVLAARNYRRSRKKYRATVLSLFMSIVLFVSSSAFTDSLIQVAGVGFYAGDFDIRFVVNGGDFDGFTPDDLLGMVQDDAAVEKVSYSSGFSYMASCDEKYLTAEAKKTLSSDEDNISITVRFTDDTAFQSLLKEHRLDSKDYYAKSPKALVLDSVSRFDYDIGKAVTLRYLKEGASLTVRTEKVFEGYVYHESFEKNGTLYVRYTKDLNDPYADCIELTEEDTYDQKTLYTGDILVEDPWFLMHRDTLTLLYPYSRMADVLPDAAMDEEYIVYLAASSDHALSAEEIKNTLVGLGIPAHNVTDYAAGAEENRSVIIIIQVFAYGFIILISLIAAANVFNTISTNIALRRREFAMLKSVGMTDRDFYKMMNYECLLYGSRSLLWGLPVSAAVSFVIHLAVQSGYETAFVLPLRAMAISCCSVFLVVFATMLYAVQKIRRDNPIDALKNENL